MSIVHPLDLAGPAIFRCAQAGCAGCVMRLLRQHEGLVHTVLRRQVCGKRCCTLTQGAGWPSPRMRGWRLSAGCGGP